MLVIITPPLCRKLCRHISCIPTQEAMFCTTGLHFRGSSRSYVFINTNRPEKRQTSQVKLTVKAMITGDDVYNAGPLDR